MIVLRFADLKKRGIVNSWPQLCRLMELHDFPPGRKLSPNTRAWLEIRNRRMDQLAPD